MTNMLLSTTNLLDKRALGLRARIGGGPLVFKPQKNMGEGGDSLIHFGQGKARISIHEVLAIANESRALVWASERFRITTHANANCTNELHACNVSSWPFLLVQYRIRGYIFSGSPHEKLNNLLVASIDMGPWKSSPCCCGI